MNLKYVRDEQLIMEFEALVKRERKTTAEILEYVKEIDQRRLYLKLGFTSTYDYLTKALGYSEGSAQRRIDGARLLQAVPEVTARIENGELNLMQVALVAKCVRQKAKESPKEKVTTETKKELLEKIKGQDFASSQRILAQGLDLEIKAQEKTVHQKDEFQAWKLFEFLFVGFPTLEICFLIRELRNARLKILEDKF